MTDQTLLDHDTQLTRRNRERLLRNKNLLYWYEKLYESQFEGISGVRSKRMLEIGSGTSPLKLFYPGVMTSDVMALEHLDYVFDAHEIDAFERIADGSIDIISITNVMHHLRDPVTFLLKASKKLVVGGKLIFTEPYFSTVSKVIYLRLHHESTDFNITSPVLEKIEGPLSSANIALPFLIFEKGWDKALAGCYDFSEEDRTYFSSVSYMVTGGVSRRIPVPLFLYKMIFHFDLAVSRYWPRLTASFFTMRLTKK